jgi:large subunit ribosomal protein L7/L12
MADLDKIVEQLSKLSVLEAAQLVKKLEESWGVSAAAPMAMAAVSAAQRCLNRSKTAFDVVIKDAGPKIDVIKTIRQLTNLGLKEPGCSRDRGSRCSRVSKEAMTDQARTAALSSKWSDRLAQTNHKKKGRQRWPFFFFKPVVY